MATVKRTISEIAAEIKKEWGAKTSPYAAPYLQAMFCLTYKSSQYGCDSASSIVNYFLANASTFRGEKAKALKLELKAVIK
jgi:hypothetical protein